jgi:hypothetical protein
MRYAAHDVNPLRQLYFIFFLLHLGVALLVLRV